MKFKIEIDLSDITVDYNDYENGASINDIAKNEIESQIRKKVWENLNKEALLVFQKQIERKIELDKDLEIQKAVKVFFTEKKVKKNRHGEDVSLKEFIVQKLEETYLNSSTFSNMMDKVVKDTTESISRELKARYDMLFASQVIVKMNEQGLLKDGVIDTLLNNDKPK